MYDTLPEFDMEFQHRKREKFIEISKEYDRVFKAIKKQYNLKTKSSFEKKGHAFRHSGNGKLFCDWMWYRVRLDIEPIVSRDNEVLLPLGIVPGIWHGHFRVPQRCITLCMSVMDTSTEKYQMLKHVIQSMMTWSPIQIYCSCDDYVNWFLQYVNF